jgi:hypothetical protein
MISGIIESIERLMEYIPVDEDFPMNASLVKYATIDSKYPFKDIDAVAIRLGVLEPGANTICVWDIIKLFNKFLTNASLEEITSAKRYKQVEEMGCLGSSVSQLLFDFCLAALDGDILDARNYVKHSFHVLGLHRELNLLPSIILNESYLLEYDDVRKMLTLLGTCLVL